MDIDDSALWEEWRFVRAVHTPNFDVIADVNRLLLKEPWLVDAGLVLQLPRDDLTIDEELWAFYDLWRLVHARHITLKEPALPTDAVLTVRWDGNAYLMDGRRRINHWWRERMHGPRRVLVRVLVLQRA